MHKLRMLGSIALADDAGHEVDALLRQPKHVALLSYLAMPHPGAWHRRDEVVGVLWPETDQARARSALRSALHTLRRHLPEGAIRSRGDDELSIDRAIVGTDVGALTDDLDAGNYAAALDGYPGELLPGIYIPESPAFERWLSSERDRVRSLAHRAATRLSASLAEANDFTGAIAAARRASELEPDDEASIRRWISLLDKAGDRTQAFAVYERFRSHTMESFGIHPSAETVALLDAVRTRHVAGSVAETVSQPIPATTEQAVTARGTAEATQTGETRKRSRRWMLIPLIGVATVAGIAAFAARPKARPVSQPQMGKSVVILPMKNETGDSSLAYVATGIAEGVARRLNGIGGFVVHSGARSNWDHQSSRGVKAIGEAFGSRILIESSVRRSGDSLEVSASVVDAATLEATPVANRAFSVATISDVQSRLTADIAGTVFRIPLPLEGRPSSHKVDPESYRLMLEGWHILLNNSQQLAPGTARRVRIGGLFLEALRVDPLNARAWSGLSSIYSAQTISDFLPFDDGFEKASAAALRALALDSLQGTALANLGIIRATKAEKVSAGIDLIRKAEAVEPWNPEIALIKGSLYINAHEWEKARDAFRVARQLDPLSPIFAFGETRVDFCTGRPEAALATLRAQLATNPIDQVAMSGMARASAMKGSFDEAIAWLARLANAQGDTAKARRLAAAKGAEGYWRLQHEDGRRRLAELARQSGYVSPLRFAQAYFAAGDVENGYRWLEKSRRARIRQLHRLQCMGEIDEFRTTTRFLDAVREIGPLGP